MGQENIEDTILSIFRDSYSYSGKGKYAMGYKFCSTCRVYFKISNIRCPICGKLMRSSPRKKSRNNEREEKSNQTYFLSNNG